MASEDILSQPPPPADSRISYGRDPQQFLELRIPQLTKVIPSAARRDEQVEGPAFCPLAICLHGGFWRAKYDLVHAGHLCAALTHAGVATLNIEYRRVGNAGGGWPGSFEDVSSAFQAISESVKKYQLEVGRTVVIGHSAGGQLALALAARQLSLRGAVALAPVSNLRRAYDLHLSNDAVVGFLGGTPSQVPDRYREASPIELSVKVPQVIIHGTHDDTVPVEMSRSYVEAKRKRDEDVHLIELDCGHFELIDPLSNAWPMVERAVLDLLKP